MSEPHMTQSPDKNPPRSAHALSNSFARVPVTVQVLIGSTRIALPDLLALTSGSTFVLDQKLGSPVTIIVNGCKIATGELYVLDDEDERLGIKVSELLESQPIS